MWGSLVCVKSPQKIQIHKRLPCLLITFSEFVGKAKKILLFSHLPPAFNIQYEYCNIEPIKNIELLPINKNDIIKKKKTAKVKYYSFTIFKTASPIMYKV